MDKGKYEEFLSWRGICKEEGDIVCDKCNGSGISVYGNTATWSSSCGGNAMTRGVCDKCWGSGKSNAPWVNLRKVMASIKIKEADDET